MNWDAIGAVGVELKDTHEYITTQRVICHQIVRPLNADKDATHDGSLDRIVPRAIANARHSN